MEASSVPTTKDLYEENPEFHGVEETVETETVETTPPLTNEDFEHRVTRLMELMAEDPVNRDRILAEIYVNMASAEMGIRGVFESIQAQGISGLMKGAFRRK